jgi:hypothetical protein
MYDNSIYNPDEAEKLVGRTLTDEDGFEYEIVGVEHNQDDPFFAPQFVLEQDLLGEKKWDVATVVEGVQNGDYSL